LAKKKNIYKLPLLIDEWDEIVAKQMNWRFFAVIVFSVKLVDKIAQVVYIIVQNIGTPYRFVKKNHEVYFIAIAYYYRFHFLPNRQCRR